MVVINFIRWFAAIVVAFVFLPIIWVLYVITLFIALILGLLEEFGLDVAVASNIVFKPYTRLEEISKAIICKIAPRKVHNC